MQNLPKSDSKFLKPENAPFGFRALEARWTALSSYGGPQLPHDLCNSDLASEHLSFRACTLNRDSPTEPEMFSLKLEWKIVFGGFSLWTFSIMSSLRSAGF